MYSPNNSASTDWHQTYQSLIAIDSQVLENEYNVITPFKASSVSLGYIM